MKNEERFCAVPSCKSPPDVYGFCYRDWLRVPIADRQAIWDGTENAARTAGEKLAETEAIDAAGEPVDPGVAIARVETDEARDMLEAARGFSIETRDDLELAATALAEVKGRLKRIDEAEKSITKPMREALDRARGLFRPAKEYLGEVEREFKRAIAEREAREADANREAVRLAAEAHARGDAEAVDAALERATSVAGVEGVQVRKTLDFRIVDEDAIPRELCSPNPGLIRAAIRDGVREIPGLEIFEKAIVASKSAK